MTQHFDFSVVICTYNGEQRLPEVLDRLEQCQKHTQTVLPDGATEPIKWEIIVVDNNSSDGTAKVVRNYQAKWPDQGCPLRYRHERRQGAAYARKTGIVQAQSQLIGFLDDDNLPAEDWVTEAVAFAHAHPQAGAFGSQIHGEYEVEPGPELAPVLPFLAIVERGDEPSCYDSIKKVLPPSAGLVVRREAWEGSIPAECFLGGRTIQTMVTGEDTEALTYIQRRGWEIWYNPAMHLWHKIPSWRLQREYLIPFFHGIGLSRHVTRTQSLAAWLRPLAVVLYMLNDLRKIVMLFLQHGLLLRQNLVAHCQLTLAIASVQSPWYLWKQSRVKPVRSLQAKTQAIT